MLSLTRSTSPSSSSPELELTNSSSSSSRLSSSRFCPSTTLSSLLSKHSLPLSRSSSNSSSKSNCSSNSSSKSNCSSTSSTSSTSSSAASTPSSSPRLPLINLVVLSDTPPLRRVTPKSTGSSSRPRMQRRDTPAYRSPREGGGEVELKVGGWVGVVEEA